MKVPARLLTRHTQSIRAFPAVRDVAKKMKTLAVTVNEDGQWSGPLLSAWYVAEFCRLNNLKHA